MVVEDSEVREIARALLESQELAEEMEMTDMTFKIVEKERPESCTSVFFSFHVSMKEEQEGATRESLGPGLANKRGTETEFLNVAVS